MLHNTQDTAVTPQQAHPQSRVTPSIYPLKQHLNALTCSLRPKPRPRLLSIVYLAPELFLCHRGALNCRMYTKQDGKWQTTKQTSLDERSRTLGIIHSADTGPLPPELTLRASSPVLATCSAHPAERMSIHRSEGRRGQPCRHSNNSGYDYVYSSVIELEVPIFWHPRWGQRKGVNACRGGRFKHDLYRNSSL